MADSELAPCSLLSDQLLSSTPEELRKLPDSPAPVVHKELLPDSRHSPPLYCMLAPNSKEFPVEPETPRSVDSAQATDSSLSACSQDQTLTGSVPHFRKPRPSPPFSRTRFTFSPSKRLARQQESRRQSEATLRTTKTQPEQLFRLAARLIHSREVERQVVATLPQSTQTPSPVVGLTMN